MSIWGEPTAKGGISRRSLLTSAGRLALMGAITAGLGHSVFAADPSAAAFAETLAPADRQLFDDYISAQTLHDFKLDTFWREVANKRAQRRAKKKRNEALAAGDYVEGFPPRYSGPTLPEPLAKRWAAFQAAEEQQGRREPPQPKPGLAEFLALAKSVYNFTPEVIPEREFKLRYAREALSLGLTKDQVVRVYALETSGLGTADMVSGIHPIKKTGTPISTAIGYAQLLAANTTDELTRCGPRFLDRLRAQAQDTRNDMARRALAHDKYEKLKVMLQAVRSIPAKWESHVAFSKTEKGLGIHAINLDGDIGPWLQVVKLQGLREMAEKAGIAALTGAEIELMNLAGPGTALEMMQPQGLKATTPNFFERGAYGRNTIVREKTSADLLAALNKRMEDNIGNPGAIEFAAAFDAAAAERQTSRN